MNQSHWPVSLVCRYHRRRRRRRRHYVCEMSLFYYYMADPQVADEGDGLQVWTVAHILHEA